MVGPMDYRREIRGEYALVHFRGSYLAVDLDDMLSANRILDVIGRDGALELNLPIAKSPLRYWLGSQTLIFLSEMANGILNRNPTTRANVDTRLSPNAFYEPGVNLQIAIHELGGFNRLMIS